MIGLRGIPAKSGGVEAAVEKLAPHLKLKGSDVTVYCRTQYCTERPANFQGVSLKYIPTIDTKYTEALVHSFLCTLDACTKNFDIIHYHALGNGLFSIIPKLFGKKTVVTVHGLDYEREKWGLIAKIYLRLSELILNHSPVSIISVSKKIKRDYKTKFGKEIDYIPNGVDPAKKTQLNRLRRFELRKGKYILFLSRIVPEKGLHYLINAFSMIDTEYKLVIAGDATHTDGYLAQMKQEAKYDDRVVFSGPLFGADKREAFSNAAFFVLPSTIEGMPIVLLESMSYGLCNLVSDIEENLDVIEKNKYGVSFTAKDTNSLKEKMEWMIRNPKECQRLANRARNMVIRKYQWDQVAKRTMEVYESRGQKR